MKKQLLLGTALGALTVINSALAADLPVKAPPRAPIVPAYNWAGCYVGGNIGYSWGTARGDLNIAHLDIFSLPTSFSLSLDPAGVIGGGQIGCNWQYNNGWVLGLETDFQGSGEKATQNFSGPFVTSPPFTFGEGINQSIEAKIEWFGTVRGRVGYLVTPTLMLYGTGGLAYGETKVTDNVRQNLIGGGPAFTTTSISNSTTRVGWTLGAGAEGALFNWNNWTWKVEYLYVDLGSQSASGVDPVILGYSWNAKFTDNIVRFGLNYRIP
jgi:outer membrane immunogenic protein